jgi:hypothetical protein
MTVTETAKSAIGLSDPKTTRTSPKIPPMDPANEYYAAATREAMSEARLPLAYRDSCANLLIPLNRCRFESYYLPWKCEVCSLAPMADLGIWGEMGMGEKTDEG